MEPRFRSGAGRPSLDLVRTLRHRGRPDEQDELRTADDLIAWIRQLGPYAPGVELHADRVRTARDLREAIHRSVTGAATDTDRFRLNAAAAGPVPYPHLGADGTVSWWADDDPVAAALAWLARDAVELVASPDLARVRRCANPDCGALFLDSSRPGTRRWCSMGTCGNQAKKQALRARTT